VTGRDHPVVAEVRARRLPGGAERALFCGVGEIAALLEGIPGVDVDALPEGAFFGPEEPVLNLSGRYTRFAVHETAILGLISQASGIATGAARCRRAAGEKVILSFGARRQHPVLAPMIERAAWIGGADGVSSILAAEMLGIKPTGTMPHAIMLVIGDTVEGARLFDATIDPAVARIVLVDTFGDEAAEAVRVAADLGPRLTGVRLDTPASRRGDFRALLLEVRWELDLRGFQHVKIFASGGLGEEDIFALRDVADGFGIGSAISQAPHVDFALDIVEVDGRPRAKKGKLSGGKMLWRCPKSGERKVLPAGASWARPAGFPAPEALLQPLIRDGRIVSSLPTAAEIRRRALAELSQINKR
jgi:nicotinate phosphoribosyltransferase